MGKLVAVTQLISLSVPHSFTDLSHALTELQASTDLKALVWLSFFHAGSFLVSRAQQCGPGQRSKGQRQERGIRRDRRKRKGRTQRRRKYEEQGRE